ncbi:CHAT domain-containing protein [Virgisporangium aurantiacum]|uniref:CHAT domain-containing protein n=1 Tax=Virgisporangium aurantiacum TaxID=175570 RepID=A0A8J3Z225_9ACTN|nr:CHAT domain-containing protein [Virgisporangium aurantiacum]GIJ54873.1 hypothetical protein Vau01_023890 [Virgisporangium aurantiacum]
MHLLGIDFGTSNTVGMLRLPDGRVRPLLFDGSPLLPSAVYLDTAGTLLVGRDAGRRSRLDPRRFEPHPKSRIDDGGILLGDRELLIFLNACRSAGIAPYYTRMMGWAEQLMSAGAGAFIGTLWPVETTKAATFAEVFYAALLAGESLGAAGLKARRTIEDTADPSWLAYTTYGNPNAVATRI